MKCISILVLVVCVCMTTGAWSQQSASVPHLGRSFLRHHLPKGMSSSASVQGQSSAQASPALNSRVWQFGTYPGGTWAALEGINDFAVAVGFGDVPPLGQGPNGEGYTHTLAVPVFGPHAGEWIDLGTLGGEYSVR